MRELRVEDALTYLDQVKVEFSERPHIYNEFLDIMKTFKTQQLDTPGVIRRVSTLFQGNKNLVLGFNTFLPEGYKIELPKGGGPPVAVYRAPGSTGVMQILGPDLSSTGVGVSQPAAGTNGEPSPRLAPSSQVLPPGVQRPGSPQAMPRHVPPQAAGGVVPVEQFHSMQQQQQAAARPVPPPGNGENGHPQMGAPSQPVAGLDLVVGQGPLIQPGGAVLRGGYGPPSPPPHAQPQQQDPHAAREPPVEFDHAINYVTTIKKRFATEPETYKKFLEILHTYQKEQRGIKEVLDEVSLLFADHPDLLKQFTYFLPDAVQATAKAQLDQVAKESEARQRAASSKQAIMQTAQGMQRQAMRGQPIGAGGVVPARTYPSTVTIPFGATQGRSDEREREICRSTIYGSVSFNPVRPPRRSDLSAADAALKNGRPHYIPEIPVQPTTAEAAFFERAKLHLNRRELAPDKPPGSRRHTPFTEFLKCLHLFGADILSKEELLLLLRSLFMQGHAPKSGANAGGGASNPAVASDASELLREFEEILVGRGPYAEQEELRRDKSRYGAMSLREYDYSHCEAPTPSYHTYPADFPKALFYSHAGRTEVDSAVLNDDVVCVAQDIEKKRQSLWSAEAYDALRVRRNANEEAMFKVEDERYEVDMAIERNVVAMRQVEPMAEEVTHLRENEEKDGQPIGRMQYALRSRMLTCTQLSAIARLYGDKGDEVIQHLLRNPVAVLPIVYQRLRQKDADWRRAKGELSSRWDPMSMANFEGSLDVLCYSYKKELEKAFAVDRLVDDCKRAGHFARHPRKNSDHPAVFPFKSIFALMHADPGKILFQPHLMFNVPRGLVHKDAFQLIASMTEKRSVKLDADREQACRIWSEWLAPMFSYDDRWIVDTMRGAGCQKLENTTIVQYVPGQTVITAFGSGVVVSRIAPTDRADMRYKVKLPYGNGYIHPSSVLRQDSADGRARIRRNGVMEPFDDGKSAWGEGAVDANVQLLFATEAGYILIRLYTMLTSILENTCDYLIDHEEELIEERKTAPLAFVGKGDISPPPVPETNTYNYSGLLQSLEDFFTGNMDASTYESYCRKLTKQRVYQLVALPKLVEQCAEALVKVSRDEINLRLYDLSCVKIHAPERLRRLCYAETTEACYRMDLDATGCLYCTYIAPGEPVLLERQEPPTDTPSELADDEEDDDDADMSMADEEDDDDEGQSEGAEGMGDVPTMDQNGGVDTTTASADTAEDADIGEPRAKRPKL